MIKAPNMANPYVGPATLCFDFTHEMCFTEISLKEILATLGFKDITILGTNIYTGGTIIDFLAKYIAKLVCLDLYIKSWLFGRKSIKIFEKNLLAVARK